MTHFRRFACLFDYILNILPSISYYFMYFVFVFISHRLRVIGLSASNLFSYR